MFVQRMSFHMYTIRSKAFWPVCRYNYPRQLAYYARLRSGSEDVLSHRCSTTIPKIWRVL